MFVLFIKSLFIGLAIAAPVGPIGVLCIQRSLQDGFKIGLVTGMGAATADAIYGFIAAFGLTAISTVLLSHQLWIRVVGGLFLIYLGIKFFLKKAIQEEVKPCNDKSPWHAYLMAIFMTITNPATIISFMAIFAGIGLGSQHNDYIHATVLVTGIFLGSAAWWLILSSFIAKILHHRMTEKSMVKINWVSGVIMLTFGLYSLKILL